MTRFILILILIVMSFNVTAEWLLIGESNLSDDMHYKIYVSSIGIHKYKDRVTGWFLHDLRSTNVLNDKNFLSTRSRETYDCNGERMRTTALTFFSGNMGSGGITYDVSDLQQWKHVEPDTTAALKMKYVCAHK